MKSPGRHAIHVNGGKTGGAMIKYPHTKKNAQHPKTRIYRSGCVLSIGVIDQLKVLVEPKNLAILVYSLETHAGLGTAHVTAIADISNISSINSCSKKAIIVSFC
tara:strand:- start:1568 stop:1882 length:315 start_codon:yes stop_codon:yes gene_type:complete